MIKKALIVLFFSFLIRIFYPSFSPSFSVTSSFAERVQLSSPHPLNQLSNVVGPFVKWVARRVALLLYKDQEGVLVLEGVKDEVEILTDNFGVPHIYAKNEDDLYFALGYVHASERLWQMEFNRHLIGGRLSEFLGKIALKTDILIRSFGFTKKNATELIVDPIIQTMLHRYVQGINTYLNHPEFQTPAEFSLFGLSPKNWTINDIISQTYFIMWQMTEGWGHEISRSAIYEKVGNLIDELEIEYPSTLPSILHPSELFGILNSDEKGTKPGKLPYLEKIKGSNSWVVRGPYTKSGNTILCNDPHLPLHTPSFWFEVNFEVPSVSMRATGVSVPGIPGIIIGHNQHIAWGATLAFMDAEDLVIEKINPNNPTQYEFNGEWKDMIIIPENFRVKGDKPVFVNITHTRNGPIISEWISLTKPISFRSSIVNCSGDVTTVWRLLSIAKNWEDFSKAVHKLCVPLSLTYADTSGNIGFWATGTVPIRKSGFLGKLPIPGWTDEGDWVGFVPHHELPHSFNPEKGFIVAANHRIVEDKDFSYYLGSSWISGYRAARITELISEKISQKEPISIEFLQKIQTDVKSLAALSLVEALRPYSARVLTNLKGTSAEVWKSLFTQFDGFMTPNSTTATVLIVGQYFLFRNILEPVLGENLTHIILGAGPHPFLAESTEFRSYDITTLIRLLQNESSWWVSNAGGAVQVITKSIKMTVSWLKKELGSNPTTWQYGKIHKVVFSHVVGKVPVVGEIFNVGPYPIGGDLHTPMMTGFCADNPYELGGWATHWRYCVDMGDFDGAVSINAPGQSGNIGSPHYDDMMPLWLKGKYHPMLWTKSSVLQNLERKLVLKNNK